MDQSLANAQRLGQGLVVALLDLDHFKEINDGLGHASGDLVLREIASRLRHVVRDSDTIARLGGDEFALLLHDSNSAGALAVAQKIHSTLREAVHVDGQALHVEASIGIAVYPEHGADYDTLLRRADIAMYAAKQRRQGVLLYDSKMEASKIGRLVVATKLRTAIYNGQLTLCYQPKVDIKTGRLAGVEALVRWQHPVRGTIPPSEFIPVAEQTNLIQPLTQWVLQEATGQMQRWRDNGLDIPVAINLSARCLAEDQILRDVADVLKRLPSTGHGLTLEITESALMADAHRARELLTALRSMDVQISIDDFGTGFSSLAYLAKLPVNELKIDRGFVTGMLEDKSSKTIVGTVIAMAHELNLRVVAEGVGSRKVLDALTTLGCYFAPLLSHKLSRKTQLVLKWRNQRFWRVTF